MLTARPQTQEAVKPSSVVRVTPDPTARPSLDELAPLVAELDMNDSHSVLFFGSRAQQELSRVSDSMLDRVRAKDLGPAGEALNDMVLTLRGFDTSGLDPNRRPGWLERLYAANLTSVVVRRRRRWLPQQT